MGKPADRSLINRSHYLKANIPNGKRVHGLHISIAPVYAGLSENHYFLKVYIVYFLNPYTIQNSTNPYKLCKFSLTHIKYTSIHRPRINALLSHTEIGGQPEPELNQTSPSLLYPPNFLLHPPFMVSLHREYTRLSRWG